MFDFFKNKAASKEPEKAVSYSEHDDFFVSPSFYNVICDKMETIKDKLREETYDAFTTISDKYSDFAMDYADKHINCVELPLNTPMIGTYFIKGMIESNSFSINGPEEVWEILMPDEWRVLRDCVNESETRAKAVNDAMPIINKFMDIWEKDWVREEYPLDEKSVRHIIDLNYKEDKGYFSDMYYEKED